MSGNRFAQFAAPAQSNRFAAFARRASDDMEARLQAALAAGEAGLSPERQQQQDAADAQAQGMIEQAQRTGAPSRLDAALSGALQGATFGWHDELRGVAGALRGAVDPSMTAAEGYRQARDSARGYMRANREAHPVVSGGAEIAGALAVPIPGAQGRAMTTAGRMAGGAAAGAALGTIYGAGASEGQSAQEVASDAARGAVAGGIVGAAVPAVGSYLWRRQAQRAGARAAREAARRAPGGDDLRAQASALYEAARARGVVVQQDHFAGFASGLGREIAEAGVDDALTPRAAAALRRVRSIVEREADVSLQDMDQLRRVIGIAAQAPDPNERRLAGIMLDRLDDYMVSLSDDALRAGSADGLGAELAQARDMWARLRRTERVEEAITRAGDAASGFENGIRVEFRRLLRDGRFMRSLTQPERDLIRAVVRGTPMGNFLRVLSGWGGGRDAQRNLLSGTAGMMMGGAAGASVGGPLGGAIGAALPVVTGRFAAGRSEAMTARAADTARRLIAAGGLSAEQQAALASLPDAALARLLEGRAGAYAPIGTPVLDAIAPRAQSPR